MEQMKTLLERYENKTPEIVFEWNDPETEAKGWVVINSLRGGAAGGGTRMRKGLDKREVESLAKTMEVKFTVAGPPIGGAKSGINFDPSDARKEGVLKRWYKAVLPLLKYYYGTGGDMNVDEVHEVIPITASYGLHHPQEGVVNGHYQVGEEEKQKKVEQLKQGVSKVVSDPELSPDPSQEYLVADLITGYGVSESVRHYYDIYGGTLQGKRAIVQGWGNVGATAAYYLSQAGASIVGIIDREGGVIEPEGLPKEQISSLLLKREGNQLRADNMLSFAVTDQQIWDLDAEIFLPCAGSRLITQEQADRMIRTGLEVIACGANVPFADPEIFFGAIADHVDGHVSVIPDFIANCGMARVFAYCMQNDFQMDDQAIFGDASRTIREALEKAHQKNNSKQHIAKTAFEIAFEQLV